MAELIESVGDAAENIRTLARYAEGDEGERDFHRRRIGQGKRFVALKEGEGYLFSPSKFAGYKHNDITHQDDLDNRDGGVTNNRFYKLLGEDYGPGDAPYEAMDAAFLDHCALHGITPSDHRRARRYWLIEEDAAAEGDPIRRLARQLNVRAASYRIGQLQSIRAQLKGLGRQPGMDIFSAKTTHADWAFHHGGRSELQFNIGLEEVDGVASVRHGVAFSFDLSQTLPSIEPLIPKVRLFNDYLRLYPDLYADMRMWHYEGGARSAEYAAAPIPPERVVEQVFVFLGKRQPAEAVDDAGILRDFDRLLPLYQFVESGGAAQPVTLPSQEAFGFRAGCSLKPAATTATLAERQLNVRLRHNTLQEALYRKLAAEHGAEHVGTENGSGTGNRVDVALRRPGGVFWFYEIKTALSPRACIREAVGQLLEYAQWPGSPEVERMIVVGESPLDAEAERYLEGLRARFALPLYYERLALDTQA